MGKKSDRDSDYNGDAPDPKKNKEYGLRDRPEKSKASGSLSEAEESPKAKEAKARKPKQGEAASSSTKPPAKKKGSSKRKIKTQEFSAPDDESALPSSSMAKPNNRSSSEGHKKVSDMTFTYKKSRETNVFDLMALPSEYFRESDKEKMENYLKDIGKVELTATGGFVLGGTGVQKDLSLQIKLPIDSDSKLDEVEVPTETEQPAEAPQKEDQDDAGLGPRDLPPEIENALTGVEPEKRNKSPEPVPPAPPTVTPDRAVNELPEDEDFKFNFTKFMSILDSSARLAIFGDEVKEHALKAIAFWDSRYKALTAVIAFYKDKEMPGKLKDELLKLLQDCTDPENDPARGHLSQLVQKTDALQEEVVDLTILTEDLMELFYKMDTTEKKRQMKQLLKKHLPQAALNAKIIQRKALTTLGVNETIEKNHYCFFMFVFTWLKLYKKASGTKCLFCRGCHSILFLQRTEEQLQKDVLKKLYYCMDELLEGKMDRTHMRKAKEMFKKGLSSNATRTKKQIEDDYLRQIMPTIIVPGTYETKAEHACEKQRRQNQPQEAAPAQAAPPQAPPAESSQATGQTANAAPASTGQPAPKGTQQDSVATRTRGASNAAENTSAIEVEEPTRKKRRGKRTSKKKSKPAQEASPEAKPVAGDKVNVAFILQDDGSLQLAKDELKKFAKSEVLYTNGKLSENKLGRIRHFRFIPK